MQLNRHEPIRTAVAAVTVALLGSAGSARAADSGKIESSLLIYSETNRVKAAESVTDYTRPIDDRRSFDVRLTLDGLTGASPNGATPASTVQTFTGASGRVGYTAQPGRIPLDNTFHDTRLAADGSITDLLNRLTSVTYGAHLSIEHDYASVGLRSGITRDFFQRNTTLGLSGAYNHDTVLPIGGAPTPLTPMPPPTAAPVGGEGEGGGGSATPGPGKGKDVLDGVVSLTQILDRDTFLRADYSFDRTSGYLNDPYKLLSLVQDWGAAAPGEPVAYLYESRPTVRRQQAVFGELRRYVAGVVLDASYRYFWDDWGIVSHTVEAFPRIPLGHGRSIEPHFRWYRQTAADFYRPYLVDGQPLPQYASADSRLTDFQAVTWGLKYAMPINDGDHISFSAEYYRQLGSRGPPDAVGILGQYDLFPPMSVVMVRMGYEHGF